jgi:hypothetical protein
LYPFLKNILFFLIFIGFLYIPFLCLWGELAPVSFKKNIPYNIGATGYLFTRLQEANTVKDVDVLVLGSSLAYRGFDPRIFAENNLKMFNLGSSAQTPIQTEVLLRHYLDTLNPKTVILEVNPLAFSSDGVESSLDVFANDYIDMASMKSAFIINNIISYNALIFALYKEVSHYKRSYKEPKHKGLDTYIFNGFVERQLLFNKEHSDIKIDWDFKKDQIKAFTNVLQLLNEKQIHYVLVQLPISKTRYNNILHKKRFDNFMKNRGSYYNFNTLISLKDSLHFYDSHHLNKNGVSIFNKMLIEESYITNTTK